jgi:hypothetical protein
MRGIAMGAGRGMRITFCFFIFFFPERGASSSSKWHVAVILTQRYGYERVPVRSPEEKLGKLDRIGSQPVSSNTYESGLTVELS